MNDIEVITDPKDVAALIDPNAKSNNEFSKTLAMIEADKKKKAEDVQKLQQLREQSKPKAQPLHLKYVWAGNCPNGVDHNLKTIMVENEAGCFCICFCLTEDVQLESIKVEKLQQKK